MVGAGVCGRVAVAGRVVAAGLWPIDGWAWVVRGAGDAAGAGRGDAAGVWPIGGKAWVVARAGAWVWVGAGVGAAVEAAGGVAEGGALFRSRVRLEPARGGGGVVACPEITRAAARAIMGMARPSRGRGATASATSRLGQSDPEGCALARRRDHADRAALQLDQSLGQGQADAVPLDRRTLKAQAVEGFEQLRLLL